MDAKKMQGAETKRQTQNTTFAGKEVEPQQLAELSHQRGKCPGAEPQTHVQIIVKVMLEDIHPHLKLLGDTARAGSTLSLFFLDSFLDCLLS
jgi:hypothetical protein